MLDFLRPAVPGPACFRALARDGRHHRLHHGSRTQPFPSPAALLPRRVPAGRLATAQERAHVLPYSRLPRLAALLTAQGEPSPDLGRSDVRPLGPDGEGLR